jgi:ubiquinone/menaquinone biosynthesis C-methylase UbiE
MSIEKAYNTWSSQYDTNQNKTRDLDKKATKQTLDNYVFNNVIELGCGTGKNTQYLIKRASQVIALDFSQKMLDKAKLKVNDKKVTFVKTDLMKPWDIDINFADLITCSLTLEHIENLDTIFTQANKKLKTDGLFFICELHPFKQYLGSKARFETANGIVELDTFIHHTAAYLQTAKRMV